MTFDIRRTDLGKLNSLTKYPSILTYHALGDKGALRDAVQVPFAGRVLGDEKVDGTNTRLVFCPDGGVVVGSREDLLAHEAVVESLAAKGALRPGLDVAAATDRLWTLNHPDVWSLLVGRRGWTPEEYERWLADSSRDQLLG